MLPTGHFFSKNATVARGRSPASPSAPTRRLDVVVKRGSAVDGHAGSEETYRTWMFLR